MAPVNHGCCFCVSGSVRKLLPGAIVALCTSPACALRALGCPVCVVALTVVLGLISVAAHLSDGCAWRRRRCAWRWP